MKRNEFLRNVFTLVTGTAIAQAIPVLISPLLTRLYMPEDFGVYAVFLAVSSIIGSVVAGRYELAVMLPRKNTDACYVMLIGFLLVLLFSGLLLAFLLIMGDLVGESLGVKEISSWIVYLPLMVFLIGCVNLLTYYNNRQKCYSDIRNSVISKSIGAAIIQVLLGVLSAGSHGLIVGGLVSQFFSNMRLFLNFSKGFKSISKIKISKCLVLGKRYLDFPKYNVLATLADLSALYMPLLVIPFIYGVQVSGFFFMAQRIVAIPTKLLAKSVSQVFLQRISINNIEKKECYSLFFAVVTRLAMVAFPISIGLYFFSESVFVLIFGEAWRLSGIVASYLSVVFFVTFVVSPVSSVFSISGRIKIGAAWKHMYFLTTASLFIIVYCYHIGFESFMLFFIIHELFMYFAYFLLIYQSIIKMDCVNNVRNTRGC